MNTDKFPFNVGLLEQSYIKFRTAEIYGQFKSVGEYLIDRTEYYESLIDKTSNTRTTNPIMIYFVTKEDLEKCLEIIDVVS